MTKYRTIVERVFPFEGVCARCLRERIDLFQHPDGNRYCANVFVCEARYYIQGERARGDVVGGVA